MYIQAVLRFCVDFLINNSVVFFPECENEVLLPNNFGREKFESHNFAFIACLFKINALEVYLKICVCILIIVFKM